MNKDKVLAAVIKLESAQQTAMTELIAGRSVAIAADAAGVHRTTVHRWIHEDPNFASAYNAWQEELRESARARLIAFSDAAVSTVGSAIQNGDVKTSLTVLKNLGLLSTMDPGSTDTEELRRRKKIDEIRKERELEDEEMKARAGI